MGGLSQISRKWMLLTCPQTLKATLLKQTQLQLATASFRDRRSLLAVFLVYSFSSVNLSPSFSFSIICFSQGPGQQNGLLFDCFVVPQAIQNHLLVRIVRLQLRCKLLGFILFLTSFFVSGSGCKTRLLPHLQKRY